MPQVYYVGLLAGENDLDAVERTGEGRSINRHDYRLDEIRAALERPVVGATLDLIRLRNSHPAFDGELFVEGHGEPRGSTGRFRLRGSMATRRSCSRWTWFRAARPSSMGVASMLTECPVFPILLSTDLDATRTFYRDVLGLEVIREDEDDRIVFRSGAGPSWW